MASATSWATGWMLGGAFLCAVGLWLINHAHKLLGQAEERLTEAIKIQDDTRALTAEFVEVE